MSQDLCRNYNIPTAQYEVFNDAEQAKQYIRKQSSPVVVKADGLAAGKGVIVASSSDEACAAVDDMLINKAFGSAGLSATPCMLYCPGGLCLDPSQQCALLIKMHSSTTAQCMSC